LKELENKELYFDSMFLSTKGPRRSQKRTQVIQAKILSTMILNILPLHQLVEVLLRLEKNTQKILLTTILKLFQQQLPEVLHKF
jgi:hypothetical protein